MRIARMLLAGTVAAAAALATPVLAKHSEAQRTDDKPDATSCNTYQQAADGSWIQKPCAEVGSPGARPQTSAATQGAGDEAR